MRGQLDFAAGFTAKQHPEVLAKGIFAMLGWGETATLLTIPVPALVVTGDHDKLTQPVAGEHMAHMIPVAQVTPILPAGHAGLLEQNGQYDEVLTAFAHECFSGDPNAGVPPGGVGAKGWES
jgi:pimeloyl-ACP methyl ester carboxylesterase